MAFNPEDVLNKNFTATQFRRGYDEHEVDDFLDEIVVELRRLGSENEDLGRQLQTCMETQGVVSPEAKDKVAAARLAVEQAEQDSAARIASATAEAEKAEAEAEHAEAVAAERKRAAEEAAEEIARSAAAMPAVPAVAENAPAERDDVSAVAVTSSASAAGVLALAEKLHEQYVSEGQETRERLISEGQSRHDQVIHEATTKQEELESSAQAQHDALIAEATAQHEQLITEARERSTGMLAEAQQKRAEVLQALSHEHSSLQTKIDEMKTFERDYRVRLKSHLEGQLHQLEEIGVYEPAGADSNGKVDLEKQADSEDEAQV
jgi:DivIVA domain-containing protein